METDYQDMHARVDLAGVESLIARRWSPRAYLADPVSDEELALVFEAARLSPSCYNEQPWRFFTSTASSREAFLSLLVEGNQAWAHTAPVIGFVVASRNVERNGKDNFHAAFDSGAAWMALSLQARALGLYTHGMGGIHYEQVYAHLGLDPEQHEVLCGFTIGRLDPEGGESLSERKALSDLWTPVG